MAEVDSSSVVLTCVAGTGRRDDGIPAVLGQDGGISWLSFFLHTGTHRERRTRWAASLWLRLLMCLDSMGTDCRLGMCLHLCLNVYRLGQKRIKGVSVMRRQMVERHFGAPST